MSLRCTMWHLIHMLQIVYHLCVNTCIISYNYHFYFVVKTFQIHFLSNFQLYNVVLLTINTMLYIRSPEFVQLISDVSTF